MDHPRSRPTPPPIWSDEIATVDPDHDEEEEEEDESTEDEDEEKVQDGKKKSVSLVGSRPPRKKRIAGLGVRDQSPPTCQVQKCAEDLTGLKQYHRRHKICGYHAKATFAIVAGLRQRFCQQCSRFHELHEFDDKKRSCRRRLAGHNERRRKSSSSVSLGNDGPHSSRRLCIQLKENQYIHEGERGRG